MTLRLLFSVHAIVTLAAGVVLIVALPAIEGVVGIRIEPNACLLCYLLAAYRVDHFARLRPGYRK
jgi:multisubunit Na+/H+ antiporter MnhC subunit